MSKCIISLCDLNTVAINPYYFVLQVQFPTGTIAIAEWGWRVGNRNYLNAYVQASAADWEQSEGMWVLYIYHSK